MSSCSLLGTERNNQDHKMYREVLSGRCLEPARYRVQITSAEVAGSLGLIKIPTHTYCMENYRLKLQPYTLVCNVLISVVSILNNTRVYSEILLVRLQSYAFIHSININQVSATVGARVIAAKTRMPVLMEVMFQRASCNHNTKTNKYALR